MAKDQGFDDQMDSDEELLDFDLDDLSLSEDSEGGSETEEEIIELVELVERSPSEDVTRDLKLSEWSAGEGKKLEQKAEGLSEELKVTSAAEEEPELDLSDISLEMDAEPSGDKAAAIFSGDEITEADLEGLLQEEEGITLDLTEEGLEIEDEKAGDEISEADLQALLAVSGEQSVDEKEEEEDLLEILEDEEGEEIDEGPLEETQVLDLKSPTEESIVMEEPADILAKEIEELGAAAALEEEEGGPVEIVMPEEEEEEAERATVSGVAEERVEEEAVEEEPYAEEALAGISEEKMEGIIRKVVGEVVERVARETMTEVAERMIGEAIDALRRDLEASDS
jgi:hypothetical protein